MSSAKAVHHPGSTSRDVMIRHWSTVVMTEGSILYWYFLISCFFIWPFTTEISSKRPDTRHQRTGTGEQGTESIETPNSQLVYTLPWNIPNLHCISPYQGIPSHKTLVWPDSKSLRTLACVGIDIVITRCHMLGIVGFRIHGFTDSYCFSPVMISVLPFWEHPLSFEYPIRTEMKMQISTFLGMRYHLEGQAYQPWKWGGRV